MTHGKLMRMQDCGRLERMLLSLKESLSEKETRRYNIMQDLEAANSREDRKKNC